MVISDTHGDISRALELYRKYDKALSFDALIHCGDYEKDAARLEPHVGCPIISVPGNCDGCHSRSFKILNTPGGRILITHGYAERVKESFTGLYFLALENDCRSVAFPCISTGVYGYPPEAASEIAVREVKAFLAENPHVAVTFCCFSDRALETYRARVSFAETGLGVRRTAASVLY